MCQHLGHADRRLGRSRGSARAPDPLGHGAKKLGRGLGVPVVASVHTRFETYFEYYGVGWLRRYAERILKRFYAGLDEVFVTSEGFGEVLREQGLIDHSAVWSRGVDKLRFTPAKRSLAWRRGLGIADDDVVIAFVGRLVLEKGLDVVAATIAELTARGVPQPAPPPTRSPIGCPMATRSCSPRSPRWPRRSRPAWPGW
jgi:glycosyltransferase involved in cell wall biosynthesis